ncbi:MAG: Ku protein [Candidatus Eiseniibacteriota bacterium]
MPPHSIGSGTISFGLVSIPVRMFTAASSESVSFNQLHPKCGGRIKQQLLCPTCNEIVERNTLVKGYEFAKDQYVQFTEEELKALEGEASRMIDIAEFVPLAQVDPIYFEKTYYLGPDKGGEKAYRLLTDAMLKAKRVALAKFCMRGKESLVLIRPAQNGLMLHTMYFADEVRDFGEVDKGDEAKIKPGELDLADRLIGELSNDRFRPDQYADDYRDRVLAVVEQKVEGKEVTSLAPQAQRTQVIDLMDALKQSLGKRGGAATGGTSARGAAEGGAKVSKLEKKPAARARQKAEPAPREKKVGGKR